MVLWSFDPLVVMEDLPKELILYMSKYFDLQTTYALRCVSKEYKELSNFFKITSKVTYKNAGNSYFAIKDLRVYKRDFVSFFFKHPLHFAASAHMVAPRKLEICYDKENDSIIIIKPENSQFQNLTTYQTS